VSYLRNPNNRDREILKFAKKFTDLELDGVRFYTRPLGFYDHCADEYEVLIVRADRNLVKRLFEVVESRK
jgi:hypothetical protein